MEVMQVRAMQYSMVLCFHHLARIMRALQTVSQSRMADRELVLMHLVQMQSTQRRDYNLTLYKLSVASKFNTDERL